MAFYKSGRERRLSVEGRWQNLVEVEYRCTREWPEAPNRYATYREKWPEFIEVRALGMAAKFATLTTFGNWPANNTCTNSTGGTYSVQQSVVLGEGLTYEVTSTSSANFAYTIADESVFALDPAAGYEFWADVEEWFEVTDPVEDSDGLGFPNFGGAAVADSVTGRGIRFFERLKPDGQMGVSLGGLVPLTLTIDITESISDELGDIDYSIDRRGQIFVENESGMLVVSGTVAGVRVGSEYEQSVSTSSFDATNGFVLELMKGVGESGSSYGYSWAIPDLDLRWRGDFFAGAEVLDDPYLVVFERRAGATDPVTVEGSRIDEWSQRAWSGFAVLDGVTMPSIGIDERSKIRHWIAGGSLADNGDESADWRIQFRGKEWLAFTASHDEEVTLDDGSTTEGWSGSGVTISAGISIDVGSGGGSVSRVFSPGIIAEAHRYLEIEVRSLLGDGVPFSIGIQDKSWDFDTDDAGVWTTVQIDLCRPDSVTVEWDDKESRYPLDEFGEVEDSVHWGVSLIESLGFGGLVGGETYEIREIRLKRIGAAKLSFLPAFRRWGLRQAEVLDQVEPLVWSEVDGRVADCFGMSVLGGVYSWQNLTNLINSLDSLGWDVNPGLAIGDGYHNNLLEAELAWGGGVLSGSGGIHSGCDRVGSSGLEVKAQALWDEVEVYPTAGDVWSEDGDFGALTELYSAKVLRAHAWGLVLDDDGVRSGESVQLKAGSELRGSDTSDSRGFYLTRLPGGLEEPGHRVVVGATESVEFAPFTRMRHRRVLREQATAGAVSFDWHLSGMAVRASIGSGDMVRLALKGNAVSAGYFVRTLPFLAASLSVRWDLGRRLRLVLVTEEEGQIRERFSDDLGVTWSMATTLAVGNVRFPGLFIHPDGRRFVYWIEDGNVNGVIRDRSGGILQSVTGARSSVMDKGLAVGGLDQMGGRVSIELVTVESDTIISSLSTDGATFS